jgi:hypothetical protein
MRFMLIPTLMLVLLLVLIVRVLVVVLIGVLLSGVVFLLLYLDLLFATSSGGPLRLSCGQSSGY